MKTVTYAEVALLVGPFTEMDCVEVPGRGEVGLEFLKEKYKECLVAFVYYDVKVTEFEGMKFTSEPHNQERVDVIKEEDFKKRVAAERTEISNVIAEAITSIFGENSEQETKARLLH